ncbi:hypothetical protein C1H46_013960 [Malus baccata]|uniref:Uncharacterized protein n=1 Tax=Malus baccata TaxID=106549 RepID=A0A540MNX1_MALBA|nr:hypothetical protein C1H46_013960 [Malus baccata]
MEAKETVVVPHKNHIWRNSFTHLKNHTWRKRISFLPTNSLSSTYAPASSVPSSPGTQLPNLKN